MYLFPLYNLLIYSISTGTSKASRQEKCSFMANHGPCQKNFDMFAYDFDNNRCVEFVYGGCGGNPNRFQTKLECILACDALEDPKNVDIIPTDSYKFMTEQLKPDDKSTKLVFASSEVAQEVPAGKEEEVVATSTFKATSKESPEAFTLFNFEQLN
ncbi:U-actitoxin-Avd3n [Drosophila rhopaloa]|uniref:BPTI/Kunitz inhibitor domain-containing protein n=1 Tax=Drosophila rhopaloa TaxID=1041015 RepID=A0ABM5I2R2_DRORH|nr:U-actitoxin-Avd3n [Drosophila rhopaloa]